MYSPLHSGAKHFINEYIRYIWTSSHTTSVCLCIGGVFILCNVPLLVQAQEDDIYHQKIIEKIDLLGETMIATETVTSLEGSVIQHTQLDPSLKERFQDILNHFHKNLNVDVRLDEILLSQYNKALFPQLKALLDITKISSVDAEFEGITMCSKTAKKNLQHLTSNDSMIAQGNAIDLIIAGVKSQQLVGSLPDVKVLENIAHNVSAENQDAGVFDMYIYTPQQSTTGDINYNYYMQGHRFVGVLGGDGKLYILDPYIQKEHTAIPLATYLSRFGFKKDMLVFINRKAFHYNPTEVSLDDSLAAETAAGADTSTGTDTTATGADTTATGADTTATGADTSTGTDNPSTDPSIIEQITTGARLEDIAANEITSDINTQQEDDNTLPGVDTGANVPVEGSVQIPEESPADVIGEDTPAEEIISSPDDIVLDNTIPPISDNNTTQAEVVAGTNPSDVVVEAIPTQE